MSDSDQNLQSTNRIEKLLLIGLLLVAFGLRVYAIDASSLWSDEGNTWALLSRSFRQIALDAAADIHPPGYYWLLKIWTTFADQSAAAMRLFSAFSGTLLVLIIYRIGHAIDQTFRNNISSPIDNKPSHYALLATLIAALNPLQIFYSQEARMYMPLALAGALLALSFCQILRAERREPAAHLAPYILYILAGLLGLWTHYSFPICLAAVGIPFLAHLLFNRTITRRQRWWSFVRYLLANSLILIGYFPWLRIGIERVINWPKGGESVSTLAGFEMILRTFVIGPLRDRMGGPLDIHWAWLLFGGLLPIMGILAIYWCERGLPVGQKNQRETVRQHPPLMTILLTSWLFLPLIVMLVFGLFTDAFLKFLLVSAPAWSLAFAAFPLLGRIGLRLSDRWGVGILTLCTGVAAIALAWQTVPSYYANPLARDNYAGIARYIDATVIDPSASLVLLNAPGQQEVWRYYGSNLNTLALPEQRPINEQKTIESLAQRISTAQQIFALFWATDEADPNRVVEKWLDQHTFKGLDSWQGNVRFVRYDLPSNLQCAALNPISNESASNNSNVMFGADIELTQFCMQHDPAAGTYSLHAGEALLIGLRWQTRALLESRYKTTLQLVDERNQVVAQRDSEPGGGSMPTDGWQPHTEVIDNHGIVVPFGTPPGSYRLIVAMYNEMTGRLPTATGDHVVLSTATITRPERPMPVELVPMDYRIDQQMGPLTLVGYDMHRKGFAHAPQTPVSAGDLVHVTLYWQAPTPLPVEWPADLHVTMTLGDQQINAPVVRADYSTAQWENGEFVRGEFDILFNGSADQIRVQVERQSITLHAVP